jgi:hypothetical protein
MGAGPIATCCPNLIADRQREYRSFVSDLGLAAKILAEHAA